MTAPAYDPNDVLFGSGIQAATFKSPGDNYSGRITKLEAVQARKFKDGKPTDELDTWPNGDPKMQAVVTLLTSHRDPADPADDGQRKVYIASRDLQGKVRDAVRQVGGKKLNIRDFLSVTYTGDVKTESGLYAKVYEVEYQAAGADAANAAIQQAAPVITAPQPSAQIPGLGQMIQPAPVVEQPAVAAPAAAGGANLDSLPPEARALVEKMLAGQQQ